MDDGKRWSEITARAARPQMDLAHRAVAARRRHRLCHAARHAKTTTSRAYLYKSTDYGGTFTSIVNNMPAGSVNVIREDPARCQTCSMLGTDFGAFVSMDGGRRWQCSAAICRRCRSPTCSISREIGHRDLDLRPRHVGDGREQNPAGQVTMARHPQQRQQVTANTTLMARNTSPPPFGPAREPHVECQSSHQEESGRDDRHRRRPRLHRWPVRARNRPSDGAGSTSPSHRRRLS